MAPSVETTGMRIDISGGEGYSRGAAGRVVVLSDTGGFSGRITGPRFASAEDYAGLRGQNPHLSALGKTPFLQELRGGVDVAGLLQGINAGSFPDVVANAPADAHAAVVRLDVGPGPLGDDFEGYDFLVMLNLSADPLRRPVLGTGVHGYASRLLAGGLASTAPFGTENPGVLEELEGYGAYGTVIPEVMKFVTFGFNPEGTLVQESGLMPGRGQARYLRYEGTRRTTTIPAPITEPNPTITLPKAGPVVAFELPGSVRTTLQPAEAVQAGVGWLLTGRTLVYPSGFEATELPAEEYQVEFTQVPGWIPPRKRTISVPPGGRAEVTGTYTKAPTYRIGELAPQRIREGDVLGFFLQNPNAQVEVISGSPQSPVLLSRNGWFSYLPTAADRGPFEVRFTSGQTTQTMIITPVSDLPDEQTILALEPMSNPPSAAGRDYVFIADERPAAETVNYLPIAQAKELTISGATVLFDPVEDPQLYDRVHENENLSKLNIYADQVIVRALVETPGTDVTIYARKLIFEDPQNGTASWNTTGKSHTTNEDPQLPQQGGDITLYVLEVVSDPSSAPRLVLNGASTVAAVKGGDAGTLTAPFDLSEFSETRGGSSSVREGDASVAAVHGDLGVPAGLAWLHPLAVRSVLLYCKDLYYFGFMEQAGEQLREYQVYLNELLAQPTQRDLPEVDLEELQFSQQRNEISSVADRISARLDYFGNPAGWVPLLSFESNFLLTESSIGRAMRAFYLAHWLSSAANTINDRREAMKAASDALGEENDELKAEFGGITGEIEDLDDKSAEIERMTNEIKVELRSIERRLERKAEEIVAERNNVPAWKTTLRGAGALMKMVPVYQPALGAAGGALELGTRLDEQAPLDSVLQGTDLFLEYKAADYKKQADDLDKEINPPMKLSDKELERDGLRSKAGKVETLASAAGFGGGKIKEYIAKQEAAAGEIAAELEKIRAVDPQFNMVVNQLQELLDEKQRFAQRIAALEDRLREIPNVILKNRIAMINLQDLRQKQTNVLDPQALSAVKEMEARHKDILRSYYYRLAKSFEYRLLEPYRLANDEVYDPVAVLGKIETILKASQTSSTDETEGSQHHVLSPTGFQSLRAVLEKDLVAMSDRIIEKYNKVGCIEQTAAYRTNLLEKELECINKPGVSAVLNLHDRGVYSASEEAHRIADLSVGSVDFFLTVGGARVALDDERLDNLSSASVDITFEHSGLSQLSRAGQNYAFNHYRTEDSNPIQWTARVNLLSGAVTMVRPSEASESLLNTLLADGRDLNIQKFSRPAANADIFVEVKNLNPTFSGGLPVAGLGVEFTKVTINAQLDFYQSSADRLIDVRLIDPTGKALSIQPRILFDNATGAGAFQDEFGRRDSLGAVTRSFDGVNQLKITAESFYGSELVPGNDFAIGYRFVRWLDQAFNPISETPEVTVQNSGQNRVYAIYERIGDQLAPEAEEFVLESETATEATYRVTFSEDVFGVQEDDFGFDVGQPGMAVLGVTGSGRQRLVRISKNAIPAGATMFSLRDDDSILDRTGNSLAGAGQGNGTRAVMVTGVSAGADLGLRLSSLGMVNGVFEFEILGGEPDASYQVEISTTLSASPKDWRNLAVVRTGAGGAATVTDQSPPEGTVFYRVRFVPQR